MNSYEIRNAINTLRRLFPGDDDRLTDLQQKLDEAERLERWKDAELRYKNYVQSWLDAEKEWHDQQWKLAHQLEYRAAKAGWLRMRELSPRLDGAAEFEQLGHGLQNRYAQFARAVLEDVGLFDFGAWAYEDPGD